MNDFPPIIAIDGPAASGKTTIGQLLAEQLDYLLLDTGIMYRAVTLAALQQEIDLADETAVSHLAQTIIIDIKPATDEKDGRLTTTRLNGTDVTWALRSPDVDRNVSQVASYPQVRQEMVNQQRVFSRQGNIIMVGRDIGTVVLPEAPLKLYITASAEERARRRWQERQRQGHSGSYEEILADVRRRDGIDGTRQHSPMRPAADAQIVDTTNRTPEQIVADIIQVAGGK